ncbi:MAG: hypothetical protein Q7R49_05245 [Candidatus Daviesbacteria bacterium]|nr:hypothetical protein [Candidatus Daviesbacteria bacterium]
MAIHESKRNSDLEKRFRQLRQQIYGQENPGAQTLHTPNQSVYSISSVALKPNSSAGQSYAISDMDNLYKSITKIALLSSIAIGAQFLLFLLTKNHVINLTF